MNKVVQRALAIIAISTITLSAQAADSNEGFHVVVTGGFTNGGDKVATAQYTTGGHASIKAGNLYQIGTGVMWQASVLPIASQLTINYHVDTLDGINGGMKFERIPVEATFFYTGLQNWRFGLGARFIQSPKFKGHADNNPDESLTFKSTVGGLAEIGYVFDNKMWLNVRYVVEKYQPQTYTYNGVSTDVSGFSSIKGNHFGVNLLYAF